MRRTEVESWEELMAEEAAQWDAADAADDPLFDDDPAGSESYDELQCHERAGAPGRWELDPASAEDFPDRNHGVRIGPSLRWRHFGH